MIFDKHSIKHARTYLIVCFMLLEHQIFHLYHAIRNYVQVINYLQFGYKTILNLFTGGYLHSINRESKVFLFWV